MIVLDASAATEYLLDAGDRGRWVASLMEGARGVHAPGILDVEVVSALRGHVRGGRVAVSRAGAAVEDLGRMRVTRWPSGALVARAWELRDALSAYDACYVALAELLGASLATFDGSLARARHGARVELFPG